MSTSDDQRNARSLANKIWFKREQDWVVIATRMASKCRDHGLAGKQVETASVGTGFVVLQGTLERLGDRTRCQCAHTFVSNFLGVSLRYADDATRNRGLTVVRVGTMCVQRAC